MPCRHMPLLVFTSEAISACEKSGTGEAASRLLQEIQKGMNGVSADGVTANSMFFDGGTFLVLPLTYVYLPKSARAYLFPPICHN